MPKSVNRFFEGSTGLEQLPLDEDEKERPVITVSCVNWLRGNILQSCHISAQAVVRCMRFDGDRFNAVNRAIPDVLEGPFHDFLAALSRVVDVGK